MRSPSPPPPSCSRRSQGAATDDVRTLRARARLSWPATLASAAIAFGAAALLLTWSAGATRAERPRPRGADRRALRVARARDRDRRLRPSYPRRALIDRQGAGVGGGLQSRAARIDSPGQTDDATIRRECGRRSPQASPQTCMALRDSRRGVWRAMQGRVPIAAPSPLGAGDSRSDRPGAAHPSGDCQRQRTSGENVLGSRGRTPGCARQSSTGGLRGQRHPMPASSSATVRRSGSSVGVRSMRSSRPERCTTRCDSSGWTSERRRRRERRVPSSFRVRRPRARCCNAPPSSTRCNSSC